VNKCWQVAAGSAGRDYVDRFLKHGMACVGGEVPCDTMAGMGRHPGSPAHQVIAGPRPQPAARAALVTVSPPPITRAAWARFS
jgi:hypothetical protein